MRDFASRYGLGQELDEVQRSVEDAVNPIASSEIIDGRLLDVTLSVGVAKEIPHKLGRAYRGWLVVKRTGFTGTVSELEPSDSTVYIKLKGSGYIGDGSISVWVF